MYYVPDGYQRKKPSRWYASLLIALIPLFIFSLVLNVITRVPDMYEWKFNKTIEAKQALEDGEELPLQTLEEAGIFVEPAEMAQQISDYMKGSADSFYAVNKTNELYDYYIGKAASFTDDDYGILDRVKLFDNITVVLGIMSFIASVMIFLVLVKGGYDTKALYRRKFVWSMAVMLGIILVVLVYGFIPPVTGFVNHTVLGIPQGTVLSQILGTQILKNAALVITTGCVIVSLAVMYVTWLCTKSRDIFNERRYFR